MKILVIKLAALGDVVRTSFIAQALKGRYKNQNPKVLWLTSEGARPFFVNNPYVDTVITDSLGSREKLKNENIDLVINFAEEEEYAKLSSSLGCKKIGFYWDGRVLPTPSTKEWYDMSLLGERPKNDLLKINCKKTHRQLMSEIVGIEDYEGYEPFLGLNPGQVAVAEEFRAKHNIKNQDLVVGVNLGGADRWLKSLPVNLGIDLIEQIYKKFQCRIILFGGLKETQRNKEIISRTSVPLIDAGTENDLINFIALMSVCDFVISTDSLGFHISQALKKKTICLLGPTQMYEKETFGRGKIVYAKTDCVGCMQTDCKSMEKIDILEVIDALDELIKKDKNI
ncbi:MAG: glycosyltransferase family 9 protein [Candidatus Woesearchaeota archaeon]